MQLPPIHKDDYCIDWDRNDVSTGDMMYFAPDGTIHQVRAVSQNHIIAFEIDEKTEWVMERRTEDNVNALYSDIFPITVN